jgi:hypothetical protein
MEKLIEKKAEINWLFPDENQTVTLNDFREMVREAENQLTYSYQKHRKIVNEWLQNHR